MDDRVLEKMIEKIKESDAHTSEISTLVDVINHNAKHPAMGGILAGRLYNAFYYQTRRILHREPTPDEFKDFLKFMKECMTRN